MKANIPASDTIFNEKQEQFQTPTRSKQLLHRKYQKGNHFQRKSKTCNCKKSKCLKLYCDCLANGELCGNDCSCINCHNNVHHMEERNDIIEQMVDKNQEAFILSKQSKRCNCRKSHCQKKYCECFNAGVLCTSQCKCDDCHNCQQQKLNSQQIKQVQSILNECQLVNQQFLMLPSKQVFDQIKDLQKLE